MIAEVVIKAGFKHIFLWAISKEFIIYDADIYRKAFEAFYRIV